MAKKTSRNATDKAMTPVDSRHGCANPARADSGLSGYGDQAQLRFKRILAEAPLFRFSCKSMSELQPGLTNSDALRGFVSRPQGFLIFFDAPILQQFQRQKPYPPPPQETLKPNAQTLTPYTLGRSRNPLTLNPKPLNPNPPPPPPPPNPEPFLCVGIELFVPLVLIGVLSYRELRA